MGIEVRSGGTLRVVAEANNVAVLQNRVVSLAGEGIDGIGALDLRGASWQIMTGWTLRLLDDATMSVRNASGDLGAFSSPNIYLDGHTLTICGDYPSSVSVNLRWRNGANIASGGTIALNKVLMSSTRPTTSTGFRKDPSCQGDVVLSVDKDSKLNLDTAHLLSMFDRVDFEPGAQLYVNYSSDGPAPTVSFKSVSGAPNFTANASVTETVVSDSLIVRAADLIAGEAFNAPNALSFGLGAKIEVEHIDNLPRVVYTIARGTSISGKPVKGTSLVDKKWHVVVDGNAVNLIPVGRFYLIVR
jgi:hypothetical protein